MQFNTQKELRSWHWTLGIDFWQLWQERLVSKPKKLINSIKNLLLKQFNTQKELRSWNWTLGIDLWQLWQERLVSKPKNV